MSDNTLTFTKRTEFQVPRVPNFILTGRGEEDKKPLDYFTQEELRKIGAAWTEQLIKRADELASAPTPRSSGG